MEHPLFWLYVITATILVVHEIDSGIEKEWDLFHLPGGSGGFVLIHLPLIFLLILGAVKIAQGMASGWWYSGLFAGAGLAGTLLHTVFIMRGDSRFHSLVSRLLIILMGVTSVSQLILTIVTWPG
jgi:hypothetical protein